MNAIAPEMITNIESGKATNGKIVMSTHRASYRIDLAVSRIEYPTPNSNYTVESTSSSSS